MSDFALTNARIVLPDRVVHGSVHVRDGLIDDVRASGAAGLDLGGDYLIAGLIDLHTDNLERQVLPRQNARWPSRAAFLAHDAQCAAAGITTVFDALCLGEPNSDEDRPRTCREGIADMDALGAAGLLKSEHLLHLRCELPAPGLLGQLEAWAAHPSLRMISLMDHTPGFGQFGNLERHRADRLREGQAPARIERELEEQVAQRAHWRGPNKRGVLARMAGSGVVVASHDDATEAEVAENLADGIRVSEFPVSLEAARAAHARGMSIIGGAPNLVRGGSHSGNVGVAALLREGLVDALASDYVPASLVQAAFETNDVVGGVALVTSGPARIAGLTDRGRIAPGARADLVQVHVWNGLAAVRTAWRAGARL